MRLTTLEPEALAPLAGTDPMPTATWPSTRSLLAVLALAALSTTVAAQDRAPGFDTQPILVLDTGGHSAPVRRLIFTGDETKLLSAGDDKVVRVWNLAANRPVLGWTIRPRIWRGRAGAIQGMALSPADAQGQQTLALAGYGVNSLRGEISLYSFPGAEDRKQGDISGLPLSGHTNAVNALAFDPAGNILASASNDATVLLWNYRTRTQLALLSDPGQRGDPGQREVNALAFIPPDGRRLVTGGLDGTTRIWDIITGRLLMALPPIPVLVNGANVDPKDWAINALAVSPDGRWAVIGREDGVLFRYDLKAANPAANPIRLKTLETQGAVEGLAFHPDGWLATSIVHQRIKPADRPTVACDIEFRRIPDGDVFQQVMTSSNLVHALAFSPRGTYFAFAGGDDQGIFLKDLRNPAPAPSPPLAGQGASLWDVGFVQEADGALAVAYSHEQPAARPPAAYWGFDLRDRTTTSFAGNQVRRAMNEFEGWTVRPVDALNLEVSRNGVRAFKVELDQGLDRRWWSWSFVPPGPKHDRPTLAVACDMGVVIHRLPDGLRTRYLFGHNGPVYCLAPSPDGKWLATGSSDQTLRLWPLGGCDTLAPLGAEFEKRGAGLVVSSVASRSHADLGGLVAGDVVETIYLRGVLEPVSADEFLKQFPSLPTNSSIEFKLRPRAVAGVNNAEFSTTKKERPALTLFVGTDREWVLWTPRGYYDTSVTGDSTRLGWQVNRFTVANPRPTDHFPIRTHEAQLRQSRGVEGNLIDRLLNTGDEAVAFGPVAGVKAHPEDAPDVVKNQVPREIRPYVAAGGAPVRTFEGKAIAPGAPLPEKILMETGLLAIDWKVTPVPVEPLGGVELHVEGRSVAPAPQAAPGPATVPFRYKLDKGTYQVSALVSDARGIKRAHHVTAEVVSPPRPEKPPEAPAPRLRLLAIAPEFDASIPAIRFAEDDVRDLIPFFATHLVDRSGLRFPPLKACDQDALGDTATADRVLQSIRHLAEGPVNPGDTAVVVIETHVLRFDGKTEMLAADSLGIPPEATVSAVAVANALGSLVRGGCKVVVVLDGVHAHPKKDPRWNADVLDWVRQLRDLDVISVVASTRRPSRILERKGHRVLAQAVLDSINRSRQKVAGGPRVLSLADFRDAVVEEVRSLTGDRGEASCYLPDGLADGVPFLQLAPR